MSANTERRDGSMNVMLVTVLGSDLPERNTTPLRFSDDGGTRKKMTWMDRVQAEKIVMKAHRDGQRIVVVGRDAARAFEFRNAGTFARAKRLKAGTWYDVPTSGSLPPLPITWVESENLERFLETLK